MTTNDGNKQAFGPNQCSVCDEFRVTAGQQRHGGVRYCKDCIRHTLSWVQMTEEQRAKVDERFDKMAASPRMKQFLKDVARLSAEEKQAHSIGESRRRLYESEMGQ